MKADELHLERLLVQRPEDGVLEASGRRVLLADAAASDRLAEELAETLGDAAARGVLLRHGYQTGYQDAVWLRDHVLWDSELEWLGAAARSRTILGVAALRFEEVVVDRARGVFRAVAVARNSYEAEGRKLRLGPCAAPVCHRLTGYLSGYASAFLGEAVLFLEQGCAAHSDASQECRFEGRLADAWGQEGASERRLYERDAIGERLARRDREVLAQAVKIREQELELAAKRRLEEANRLKSEFLANVSHELRTPLNSIIGFTDLLIVKLGDKLPPTPRQNLERILANAEHLLGLINSILDISKIEAGHMVVHLEEVEPGPLLEACLDDARVLLKSKPVELVRAYDPATLPPVFADRLRLRQCLTNVLGNAAKFTERGSVRVEARRVRGQQGGRLVEFLSLVVSDTGPGIAPEHQASIFEPFRQVDASATRDHEGTGLGLPIVKQLLTLMGGEIQVTSAAGAGASFSLIVPLAPGADAAPAPPPQADAGARATPREASPAPAAAPHLLVVCEDAALFEEVRAACAAAPLPLGAAELVWEPDPAKGVALARHAPPAALLLDLEHADADGRELVRLLEQDPRTRELPVIPLPAPARLRGSARRRALDRGALLALVARALARAQP